MSPTNPPELPLPLEKASIFCEGLDHPEGIAVHPDGSVWAGGEAGQIYRISPDGSRVEEITSSGGFILGIAFSPDSRWLAVCDIDKQCVWRLDIESGRLTVFTHGDGDKEQFMIPNYPSFARDGTLYVSDSGTFEGAKGRIFRFDADHSGRGEIWHPGPFVFANGLALSLDEDALYVVSSFHPGVDRIEILQDGSAGKRERFIDLPKTVPDGLAFDTAGNLYISCYTPCRIYRATPAGAVEIFMDDWKAHTLSNPTNIAFGGPLFDQLFTANLGRWHLTRIDVGLKGAPLASHANK